MSTEEGSVAAERWWTWPSRAVGGLLIGSALAGPVWLVHRWSVQAIPTERRIEAPAAAEAAKRRPKMMVLPVGEFRMGSQKYLDEQPVRAVKISKRFALSETEVTQGQYQAVMGENPSSFSGRGSDWAKKPVEQVSWLDAVKYCNKLSASEGLSPCYVLQGDEVKWGSLECQGYRLPTEAEWEYAARGDGPAEYAGSDQIDEVAWHSGNSFLQTHSVGTKKANAWFLRDMSGNVWEWVWDWYTGSFEKAESLDPTGPASGSERVLRGGSWVHGAENARVASRLRLPPVTRSFIVGFRLARSFR